jgi:selT/selW/selH-like putative selenoprotein
LAALLRKDAGAEVALKPGARGAFEVIVDGTLVFSKQAAGHFPDEAALLAQIRGA